MSKKTLKQYQPVKYQLSRNKNNYKNIKLNKFDSDEYDEEYDEDEEDCSNRVINQGGCLPYYQSVMSYRKIKFYLDEDIKEPKYYRNILNTMNNLGKNDLVEIVVNTYGGRLDSAIAIISTMRNTQASCQVTVEGMAASAGSLIALAADNLYIVPSTTFMLHQGSFGSFGKQSNVVQHAVFEDQRTQNLAREIYKDFLTPSELDDLFTGKDFWMHYDEIVSRLEERARIQQEAREALEQEEQVDAQEEEALEGPTSDLISDSTLGTTKANKSLKSCSKAS